MSRMISPGMRKKQALDEMIENGFVGDGDVFREFIKLTVESTLQEALEEEQREFLDRGRYVRSSEPSSVHRNGYEPGHVKTAEGVMQVQLPQVRGLDEPYRSRLWSELPRTSESLKSLVLEMYVNGMSTRDIEQSLEDALGEFALSKSTVSRLSESLSEEYERFKERDLSGYEVAYLFVDAVYEPLRRHGTRRGVLCCWAICSDGRRVLLDLTLANSESKEAAIDFFQGMVRRGLQPPLTVTTDGAGGLVAAVEATWPRGLRVRCWFHKMQNLRQKVSPDWWPEFRHRVIDFRDAPDEAEARRRLEAMMADYGGDLPEACRCLQDDLQASLNHLHVPPRHRQNVRTVNLVERSFVEERRRTKVIPHLWGETDLTKLVFSVLIRLSERWSKRQYSEQEEWQIYALRKRLYPDQEAKKPVPRARTRRSAARAA